MTTTSCSPVSAFFSYFGIAIALSFTSLGSGYGTARAAIGVFAACSQHPEFIYKGIMPIIMAGIVGIYGLVAGVIITSDIDYYQSLYVGYAKLSAGLCVGLCGLSSGMCIGVSGDAAARVMAEKPSLFMGAMLVLIFGEVLGLYGFIVSIIVNSKAGDVEDCGTSTGS